MFLYYLTQFLPSALLLTKNTPKSVYFKNLEEILKTWIFFLNEWHLKSNNLVFALKPGPNRKNK